MNAQHQKAITVAAWIGTALLVCDIAAHVGLGAAFAALNRRLARTMDAANDASNVLPFKRNG